MMLVVWFTFTVVHAWFRDVPVRRPVRTRVRPITVVDEDVEATRALIARSVRDWLDDEWIEQECHERIGARASEAYVAAVRDGATDLGDVLVRLGSALGGDGVTAASTVSDFKDAFVGPWDVANFVSDMLAERATGETCLCSEAQRLREEAAVLEAQLERPKPTGNVALPESRWRFSCSLPGTRRFALDLELQRGNQPGDGDDIGDVKILADPSRKVQAAYAWNAETDQGGRYFRLALKPVDGLLKKDDGDTLYLNARIKRSVSGFLEFAEGTLTVKRAEPATFLFIQYPSLIAQLTVVGDFTATPLPSET